MRALTLWQPWAHAIVHLGKRLENRTWSPPAFMVKQRFAIHAGLRIDRGAMNLLGIAREQLVRGAIVATAVYAGHVESEEHGITGQEQWYNGPLAWVLEDVRVLRSPVPTRGWQGLWTLPLPIERRVHEAGG